MRTVEGGLREQHKARRRSRILEATRELLRESPEAVISTERIAERAEVSPATVYNLIGPRDKIWEALAAGFMDELERRLVAAGAAGPREVVRSTVQLFVEDPVVSRRMASAWQGSGLLLDRTPHRHLRRAMTDARTEGLLRADIDTDALAAMVSSSCSGALHQWVAESIDDDRFLARALFALDVALAAAAADPCRDRLLAPLRDRGTR
ncbi:TetR/AcrR family transcriptional regulator [Streptomyces alfalfae]|uniref:TetR family transcriptional regulator n=1 Tax=Streptomyces alfalfae TaxID=1642299 RepID=A0A1P8TR80_9ACTN|nr:TetR/AcrR family transcriptional regulator [Streptomyces alfalfae]AYA20600.1 TetR/AcrR family transcriptional regulator [Streptomyces fradiae]APY90140.1 TetR family transcriptional regulator [Streptomyces alfalfae]QQC87345.1 TetR/AcrR family transcriptional regulator [Streptomyces alfalfae]QUI29780.1 TetR/AcrR family transcriptional regulator [Streptomyces alfalfae]RXX34806.1 TetR/AcrR family transcriptional regulator [Streptomyces alfalfae]